MTRTVTTTGTIAAVRVGRVRQVHWRGEPVPTGAYKEPVEGPVEVGVEGLAGDEQGDRVNHGGRDKAVLCYGRGHYATWQAEGLDLPEGAFFENLTVDGLSESDVCLQDVWRVGDVVFQVSQSRRPCWKLASRWGIPDLARRVQATGRTGWYLRVLEPGQVRTGSAMELVARVPGAVGIAELSRVMNVESHDVEGIQRVLTAPGVPERWRTVLERRLVRWNSQASGLLPDDGVDEDGRRLGGTG